MLQRWLGSGLGGAALVMSACTPPADPTAFVEPCGLEDAACQQRRCEGGNKGECLFFAMALENGDHIAKDTARAYALYVKLCGDPGNKDAATSCGAAARLLSGGQVAPEPAECDLPTGTRRFAFLSCAAGHDLACVDLATKPHDPRCPGPGETERDFALQRIHEGCSRHPSVCKDLLALYPTNATPWTDDLAGWAASSCEKGEVEACVALADRAPDDAVKDPRALAKRIAELCAKGGEGGPAACAAKPRIELRADAREWADAKERAEREARAAESAAERAANEEKERQRLAAMSPELREAQARAERTRLAAVRAQNQAEAAARDKFLAELATRQKNEQAGKDEREREMKRLRAQWEAAGRAAASIGAPPSSFAGMGDPVPGGKEPYLCQQQVCIGTTAGKCTSYATIGRTCYR